MSDEFTLTLNSPITENQWDMITDVDFDHTNEITFHTKHGKEVKFVKADAQPERKTGKWIYGEHDVAMCDGYWCDKCGFFVQWDYKRKFIDFINDYHFCPDCGAKMEVDA